MIYFNLYFCLTKNVFNIGINKYIFGIYVDNYLHILLINNENIIPNFIINKSIRIRRKH